MIKKFLKTFYWKEPEQTENDKKIMKQIYDVIKECKNAKSFCLFSSHLYEEDREEKLRHNMFISNFKDADLSFALQEYKNLIDNHLQKRELERMKHKVPGVQAAPIENKVVEALQEEFKVEEPQNE